MIQKKVKFKETYPEEEQEYNDTYPASSEAAGTKSRRFKANHSLDSDEELDDEEGTSKDQDDILQEDDIEGQEDETIREDEGISVTPFNLKDELEEGHFDTQGNYIANKDADVTDQWLESVDWNKAENQFHPKRKKEKVEQEEEESVESPLQIMQNMIDIMKPGENVLKALRRLGGNKKPISSADRWKKKKLKVEEVVDEKAAENTANLLKLTGLADTLLQQGDFQIYEKTYEKISVEVKSKLSQFQDADSDEELEVAFKKPKFDPKMRITKEEIKSGTDINDDDDDDDNELEAAFINKSQSGSSSSTEAKQKDDNESKSDGISLSDEVSWIYKLGNDDDDNSKSLGPFTSTEMLQMKEEGKFGDGVYCRKVGSEGSFYNSNRVDFDLYI